MNDSADTQHEKKSEMDQEGEEGLIPEGSPPEEEKSPLELLRAEYDELNDKYLRLAADFENFRKRSIRETEQRIAQSIGQFARDMLEVADSLDRAIQAEGGAHKGLVQIQKLLIQVMKRQGIESFESVGQKFDPTRHEAIAMIPSSEEEGTICDQVCKGYCLQDKVIRPAQVVVSQGTAPVEQK
ncbi:MAG TPA: nucleotide exchange factor GrpE [Methanospirillum sp.]|uniref:nucleotide exchange factor GrpE n=1 Tax=Methanospirillum sp. TaxID=45200 RepID=UPI002CEE81F2|nr:nucleotide exchange factor GrpE [Methanospirillum sp.]HOJ96183.1 nucleotide exchange factor GrpE [Methanospirillum sp.]HOL40812.1 nucleotide exchange factor GrpE [Methanospirillum sp.]HPP77088.1 nucleotide exchange factor GrpE [Methanospirillum sp.]